MGSEALVDEVLGRSPIPNYALYGETPDQTDARFLHMETLEERSRPSDWKIRPHVHRDLHQVFVIKSGAGDISLDGERFVLQAPFVLVAPAGLVHAFIWPIGTEGHVLTLADTYVNEATGRFPELAQLFAQALWLQIRPDRAQTEGMFSALGQLAQEAIWGGPCREAAIEAHLLAFLVALHRLRLISDESARALSPQADIAARFRALVERRFRSPLAIAEYAAELAVSEKQLRTACMKAVGVSPLQQLKRRRVLEAKRLLSYSTMTVAEVAYSLGFDDPAYFSRFFSDETGMSPSVFRAERGHIQPIGAVLAGSSVAMG